MTELWKETLETLIEADEPEALVATLRRIADKRPAARWDRLKRVLADVEAKLDEPEKTKDIARTDMLQTEVSRPSGADPHGHPANASNASGAAGAADAA